MKHTLRSSSPYIFIIDDSMTDCRLMSDSLLRAGYTVDFATNGREGLIRALENPPHCVILDVILPDLNGYAICRQMRANRQFSTIPIILISTKNTPLDQNYALRMGANYYLVKPFSEEALLQTIQKMLPGLPLAARTQTRPQAVPQSDSARASISQEQYTLVPYRQNEDDIMLRSNPFMGAAIASDKHLRRLYAAIDGHKNIQELTEIIELDLQSTLKLLKTLWQQQYIVFYDKTRQPLKNVPIFDGKR